MINTFVWCFLIWDTWLDALLVNAPLAVGEVAEDEAGQEAGQEGQPVLSDPHLQHFHVDDSIPRVQCTVPLVSILASSQTAGQ